MFRKFGVNHRSAWLAVAVASMAIPAFGAAINITVTNGSFELPDVLNVSPSNSTGSPTNHTATGGAQSASLYTNQTSNTGNHFYGPVGNVNDPIPYWSVSTTSTMVYGIMDQAGSAFYGTNGGTGGGFTLTNNTDHTYNDLASLNSSYGYTYADGFQDAYANLSSNSTFSMIYNPTDPHSGGTGQSLGNFVAGDNYSLSFAVGTPLTGGTYNYSIIILDNGNPVATTSGSAPANDAGTWIQAAVPYTAIDGGAIGIKLSASNPYTTTGDVNFDNVVLTDLGSSDAPTIPEPASLGIACIGLLALRRRRV